MTHDTDPMTTRRRFLAAATAGMMAADGTEAAEPQEARLTLPAAGHFPTRAISSANGLRATRRAFELIQQDRDVLDACIAGVNLVEEYMRMLII